MNDLLLPGDWGAPTRPVFATSPDSLDERLGELPAAAAAYAQAVAYRPAAGAVLVLPGTDGTPVAALLGRGSAAERASQPLVAGALYGALPAGDWRLAGEISDGLTDAVAFALGAYRFDRYKTGERRAVRLAAPAGVDIGEARRLATAVARGRDLVNTPANDLGPAELAAAVKELGARYGAAVTEVTGEALRRAFPMVHAVGAAAARAPRLVDLVWGEADARTLTLVGKGVVFDTGGLDIKPDTAMLLMKKDMGGAATMIAVAEMVMGAGLPLRLRLIVPIVENAISGSAFRPGDVLTSRKGLTVEIGNTDAEGRLILADALSFADEEAPDLLIDGATLTGAARVALGPDLAALYCDDDATAGAIVEAGSAVGDPLWRMPLYRPYASMLDSRVADLNNVTGSPFAGSITAALFLQRFVAKARVFAHIDLYGWNPKSRPGRPEGGEVSAARALYEMVKRWSSTRA